MQNLKGPFGNLFLWKGRARNYTIGAEGFPGRSVSSDEMQQRGNGQK